MLLMLLMTLTPKQMTTPTTTPKPTPKQMTTRIQRARVQAQRHAPMTTTEQGTNWKT